MNLDLHVDGDWRAAAQVTLAAPNRQDRNAEVAFRYDADFALEHLLARDGHAASVRLPVNLGVHALARWPAFLIDLLPQGAARKRLEHRRESPWDEWSLLQRGGRNPVGNLRIVPREALIHTSHPGFEIDALTERGAAFIDFARESGVSVAGATDVQGEAPKCWVIETDEARWYPDHGEWGRRARRHALLKFPLRDAGEAADTMLRLEAAYQRVARQLGVFVTRDLPEYVNGALVVPRFDRRRGPEGEIRWGVESLYSIAGIVDADRTPLSHYQALLALQQCVTDFDRDLHEYFRRDVLNLAMGNRHNHGFNTAVVKDLRGHVRLAPLYDFGPTYLDERGLARSMHWEGERRDQMDWNLILARLGEHFAAANRPVPRLGTLAQSLRTLAGQLNRLPDLMFECGVDAAVVEQRAPQIGFLAAALAEVRVP